MGRGSAIGDFSSYQNVTNVPMKPIKILALCDSPARRPEGMPGGLMTTGFGRVAENIFKEWTGLHRGHHPENGNIEHRSGSATGNSNAEHRTPEPLPHGRGSVEIDIWGIGFDGWGYENVPWRIFPAGQDWNSARGLTRFLNFLNAGDYTHVWILGDANVFCLGDEERSFPLQFKKICQRKGIRSMIYFPVDCDAFEGIDILEAVDSAVTFTEYGKKVVEEEAKKLGLEAPKIHVLPHGLEPWFAPAKNNEERMRIRDEIISGTERFLKPEDFLIVNVNKNEWRKDPLRSLEILKGLRERNVPAKMILRMAPLSNCNGTALKWAADQLGLRDGVDWFYLDGVSEEELVKLYQAADLYLTTTLGEGWGLGITEALGCGTPVAMPSHTACGEIGRKTGLQEDILWLPDECGYVMGNDTRLRRRVQKDDAANVIRDFWVRTRMHRTTSKRVTLLPSAREWMSWARIAKEMMKLMRWEKQTKLDEFI